MMRLLVSGLLSIVVLLATTFDVAAEERLVAVILIKDQPRYQAIHQEFEQRLSRHTSQDYRLYVQKPNADIMSLRNSARKAVALGADLIIAYGTTAALAAQAETHRTPVLYADVYNPTKMNLADKDGSAAHYAIGIRGDGPVQTLIKVLQETTHATKIGALYDPDDAAGMAQVEAVVEMGGRKGFKTVALPLKSAAKLQDVLKKVPDSLGGMLITDSLVLTGHLEKIIAFAQQKKLPLAAQIPKFADLGGYLALENDPNEQAEVLAELAGKVLNGISLDKLSLIKPHDISLTVNLKAAERLGIRVPFEILSMTSRVIR